MSTLTLIRHGQATPFHGGGDRLSPLGETQAARLGDFWLMKGTTYDEIFSGPLARQKHTAEIVGKRMAEGGCNWPAARVIEEWAEYDANGILSKLAPQLAERDAEFKKLVVQYQENVDSPDRNRYFQRMFEVVVLAWLEGEVESPEVEPWPVFQDRIQRSVKSIIDSGGRGRRVAVFTSGGPIGVAVQQALSAPLRSAIELNWRVRNCSITEFVFGGGRLSLDCFNSIPHLDPTLLSYR